MNDMYKGRHANHSLPGDVTHERRSRELSTEKEYAVH